MEPAGAVGVVGVVVLPGEPTPPLCAKASWEPSTTIASIVAAASSATALRGFRRICLSFDTLRTLSTAYGVSWRARAERRRFEPVGCDSPLGDQPLWVLRSPRVKPGGTWPCWRGSITRALGAAAHHCVHIRTRAGHAPGPRCDSQLRP